MNRLERMKELMDLIYRWQHNGVTSQESFVTVAECVAAYIAVFPTGEQEWKAVVAEEERKNGNS